MFKCVEGCEKKAEYIFFGKSLCKYHFDELMRKAEEADREIKSIRKVVINKCVEVLKGGE